MRKEVLDNGLQILYKKRKGDSVTVQVMVNVGSNDEAPHERGISHFLEHMLFEGTTKRPTNQMISNEIEKVGGDFNAYTSNHKTCYYIRVLKKHVGVAISILSDIIQNPLFKLDDIEKERNVVLKEIDMILDEPKFYQWILFQKTLFKKNLCRVPTYGDRKVIKNLTKKKIVNFYKKHYVPNNMTVSIVGDIPGYKKKVKEAFTFSKGRKPKRTAVKEGVLTRNTTVKEKKKTANTFFLLGFRTVSRSHKDSYVLDVINGILGRGQSGKMFTEVRSKRGLAYDVGSQHIAERDFGYMAVYASIDRKNVDVVKKLVLKELKKLENVTPKDVKESKTYIEGGYLLELEDGQKVADQMLFWEQVKDVTLMKEFLKNIKKVTVADVKRVAKKYSKHYVMTVLEGK